jgi:peptidoglycan/xylan/chitin deacetylase (PgdA/CDA1 family)
MITPTTMKTSSNLQQHAGKTFRNCRLVQLVLILYLAGIILLGAFIPARCNTGTRMNKTVPLISGSVVDSHGAIVRMDTMRKVVYLISSADEFGEGAGKILQILSEKGVRASFFLTGNFLRNPGFKNIVREMKAGGHYIGPHSDRHLLYNDWEKRDSLLVTKEQFRSDMENNLKELRHAGIKRHSIRFFLPPYEWYNRQIFEWCSEMKLRIINFTPGTGTNADYTTPDMKSYKTSDELMDRLLRFEKNNRTGLNGAFILIHLGTHPDRKDKFYDKLGSLIDELQSRGYEFGRF